jgi:multiple sugar transport system permease protein
MKKTIRRIRRQFFLFIGVLLIILFFLFPVYWVFSTAFKNPLDTFILPPKIFFKPTMENFISVFGKTDFIELAINSIIAATGSMCLSILLSFPASYSLARFKMKRKSDIAFMILSLRMFPPIAIAIPFFIMYRKIGLYDTRLGLTLLYTAFNIPLATWLLIGFIKEIPIYIEEAALVDGASNLQVFRRIVLPVVSTGLMATGILCFIMSWNEFFLALILTGHKKTLPVFLYSFINFREIQWGQLMAAATIMSAPIIIASAFIRKYLVRGLTLGAVKG